MVARNGNGSGVSELNRYRAEMSERLSVQGQDIALIKNEMLGMKSVIDNMARAFDAYEKSRQLTWAQIIGSATAVALLVTGIWYIISQNTSLALAPIVTRSELSILERRDLREDAVRVERKLLDVDSALRAFIAEVKTKEIEYEQQFKSVGQMINTYRAHQMQVNCRINKNECTDVEYWPELGRLVTNGGR